MKLLLPLLLTAAVQGDDAQKHLKALEDKIAAANGYQLTVTGKIEAGGKEEGSVKGTLIVGPDGKARMTADVDFMGKAQAMTMVSDGKHLVLQLGDKVSPNRDQPKDWRKTLNSIAARVGLTAGSLMIGRPARNEDIIESMKLSDLKQHKNEKVNGRDAVVLEYKLTPGEMKPAVCKLWLNAQTHLPLKRTLYIDEGPGVSITETYSAFTLNPKIDPKTFELPK